MIDTRDFAAWCRQQPQDQTYDYADPWSCALAQYLQHTHPGCDVSVNPLAFTVDGLHTLYPREIDTAVGGYIQMTDGDPGTRTFGALAERLEALSVEA
jgi:hypothetical protein